MAAQVRKKYRIGELELEPEKCLLMRGDEPVHLPELPFQVLVYLVEHRDSVITRRELLDRFWDGHDSYEEALTRCVSTIRTQLGDPPTAPRYIETRKKVGYRFVADVEEEVAAPAQQLVEDPLVREPAIVEAASHEPALVEPPVEPPPVEPPPAERALRSVEEPRKRGRVRVAVGLLCASLAIASAAVLRGPAADAPRARQPVRSVAVLPLENLTGDPADEYFVDGITDSLITALSRIEGLKVVSRNSVFSFKGQEIDPRVVGSKLGVAAILEGSVLKRGDTVRVAVRLVSAEDGGVLWASGNYDRASSDVLRLQDDVAENVASGLRVTLAKRGRRGAAGTESVEAYQLYAKGRYHLGRRTTADTEKAIKYFQDAIDIDPDYAMAYAGLAGGYGTLGDLAPSPPRM